MIPALPFESSNNFRDIIHQSFGFPLVSEKKVYSNDYGEKLRLIKNWSQEVSTLDDHQKEKPGLSIPQNIMET